jgi:hypothetical protein
MQTPFNAAYRLHTLLSQVARGPHNVHGLDVWAEALNITETKQRDREYRALEALMEIRSETQLLQGSATALNIQGSRFNVIFDAIEAVVSPHLLYSTWNNSASYLHDGVLGRLEMIIDQLPQDSPVVDEAEINELIAQLVELEQTVVMSKTPEDVRRMLLQHVQMLLCGLRSYRIRGTRAFRSALVTLEAAIKEDWNTFEKARIDEESRQVVSVIGKIAARIFTWASVAVTGREIVDMGGEVIKAFLGDGS